MRQQTRIFSRPGCCAALVARIAGAALLSLFGVSIAVAQNAGPEFGQYRLTPGDTVDFDILNDAEPPIQVTVGADGNVLVPLVGEVAIGGLTLGEANAALGRHYRTGGFLVDPKIGLSLAAFGDVYVIGDVRNPGAFPYRPQVNVEQAVSIAGGYSTLFVPTQGAVLQVSALRHNLLGIASDVGRQAVRAARLQAQKEGRLAISRDDIPTDARPFLDAEAFASLQAGEEAILAELVQGHKNLGEAHAFAIEEAERELDLLTQRLEKQDAAIEFTRADIEREAFLVEKGRRAPAEASDLERQLVAQESISLAILVQISQARSRIHAEHSSLVQIESQWRQDALIEIQERRATIRKLVAQHQAASDQLALQLGIAAQNTQAANNISVTFKIRRNDGAGSGLNVADELTPLRPGDVLIVSIETGTAFGG